MSKHFNLKKLTKKEMEELFKDWENGESKRKAFEGMLPLALRICNKYYSTISIHESFYDNEDLQQAAFIGLWKGIETFDPNKGIELTSYAWRCIDNVILMELRRLRRTVHNSIAISIEADIETRHTNDRGENVKIIDRLVCVNETIDYDRLLEVVDKALLNISKRDREIFMLKNFDGKTQNEISEMFNISQSYVSRILKKLDKEVSLYVKRNL